MNLQRVAAQVFAEQLQASVASLSLGSAAAPTLAIVGTPGTTSRSYRVVAVSRGGKVSAASSPTTSTTTPDTLSGTNFVRVSWAAVTNAGGYLVYRGAEGIIARLAPGDGLSVDDTGLIGDGSAFPTTTVARVEIGEADPESEQDYPMVSVVPLPFTFEPELGYEEIEDVSLADSQVRCMGNWVGSLEVRVSAKDRPQREAIQETIEALFFSQEGRRGSIILQSPALTLNGTVTTVAAPVAYSLESGRWADEFAFDKRRWLWLEIECEFQALVVMDGVYTIEDYQLTLQFPDEITI